jgi:hypothetical protein
MTPVLLGARLNIGGRWYNSGSIVDLEDKDAADYLAMRMASPVPADKAAQHRRERNIQVGDVITKDGIGPRDPQPDPDPDNDDDTDETKKDEPQGGKPKLNPHPERQAKRR